MQPTPLSICNIVVVSPSINNKHHMLTRLKTCIFKLKIYTSITFEPTKPNSLKEVLANKSWPNL